MGAVGGVALLFGVSAALQVVSHPGIAGAVVFVLGVLIAGIAATILGSSLVARVVVEGSSLRKRSLLGSHRWPIGQVSAVVRVTLISPTLRDPLDYGLILGAGNRCLARMETSWWWSTADVDRLALAVGHPIIEGGRLTAAQAEDRYPGSAAWWLRHPWGFALPLSLVLVVVVCVLIAVFGAAFK
jgi:hypothetical protein